MMGDPGLFNVWVSCPLDVEDMVVSLWVVLGYIEEGFTRQALHHPGGIRRKKKREEYDLLAWWREVCVITKWDPDSRKWEGEPVRFRCAADGVGFRYSVHLNWTPVCGSRVRYENAAWSSMCVPESARHVDLFWSVLSANI